MKKLPYRDLSDSEASEYQSFDANYGVMETLEIVDKQLEPLGLEVETIETFSSWYSWRIVPRT